MQEAGMDETLIWGAGAIGGTIGAYLVRAGHAVRFVDVVEDHVQAIESQGLRISGPVDDFTVHAQAVTPQRLTGQFSRILLAVKAHHTAAAAATLASHLTDDGYVVSCQNGLNELVIAEAVGTARTIGAFVNFGADWEAPGHIVFGNRGAVVLGELDGRETPRLVALHALLRHFEPDAVISDNIWGYLWGKTGYGAILKASALTNDTIADFIGAPAQRRLILQLVGEMMAVAQAEGVTPLGFNGFDPQAFIAGDAASIERSIAAMVGFNRASAKARSGIWRDLAVRRRPTDAGAQLAPVLARARAHEIATPAADALVAAISAVERGDRAIGEGLVVA
jgi:2-dehydropantoate 2-reductase